MMVTVRLLAVLAILGATSGPVAAAANTFACCTPEGTCVDTTMPTCEELDGISVPGTLCVDSPCSVMVPVGSPAALFVLVTVLLTLTIYGLMRRARRE